MQAQQTNQAFIEKINSMLNGVVVVEETEVDCFQLKVASPWLRSDMPVYLSCQLKSMIEDWFARNRGVRVAFNNSQTIFWPVDGK